LKGKKRREGEHVRARTIVVGGAELTKKKRGVVGKGHAARVGNVWVESRKERVRKREAAPGSFQKLQRPVTPLPSQEKARKLQAGRNPNGAFPT